MVYAQDSTQSFTISLTALLEGIGTITYIAVYNGTTNTWSEWDAGTWITALPEAIEGDSIEVNVDVRNEGATTDTLYLEFVSAQVTPAQASIQEMPNVFVNDYDGVYWTFTMPPNNVSVTINAGHVEAVI